MSPKRIIPAIFLLAALAFLSAELAAADTAVEPRLKKTIELYRAEGAEKALPEFERLNILFEKDGDHDSRAQTER